MAAEHHRRVRITRPAVLALIAALLAAFHLLYAGDFECVVGHKVAADLGDGVSMQTCNWEKTPGVFVRTGPLQLVKNGILILELETDQQGRLQGEYTVWDDDGLIIERGHYRDGRKEGEWWVTDKQGNSSLMVFKGGVALSPESAAQHLSGNQLD